MKLVKPAPSPGRLSSTPSLLNLQWQSLGPDQVLTSAYGSVTGRVTSIAADPSDTTGSTVYLGTAGGGVWKSSNAAEAASAVSFVPLTDDLPVFSSGSVASLSIGAVSVQPGATGVLLAGTGDPNDALDSYYGVGLLRSADGGLTWSLISNSNDFAVNSFTNFYFFGLAFSGFAWSTQTPNLVVAAVSQSAEGVAVGADAEETQAGVTSSVMGLYYSTDAGATWLLATITDGPGQVVQTSAVVPTQGGNAVTAVVWNPVRKRFYAAVRFHGYYESLDGITWTRLANQPGDGLVSMACPANPNGVGSPACPIYRGALAVQPRSGDLFALTVDVNLRDQGLWQDLCSATANVCSSSTVVFAKRLPSEILDDSNGVIPSGDYSLWLAAVPVTSDTLLFVGATDIYRCSVAAGCLFRNTTNTTTCAAAKVAPFQHAVDATFGADLSLMFFGSDSGLWRSTDNVTQTQPPCNSDDASHFQNLNGGLGSLAEVEALAQDPSNSGVVLAGLGINGTAASALSGQMVWPQVLDGYGSYVAIDPDNPENWYAQSSAGVAIDLCPKGSSCDSVSFGTPVVGYAQIGDDAYASPEPSPFILDPLDNGSLLVATCHVWRGPADGTSWSAANLLGGLYAGEGPECAGNPLAESLAATGTTSESGVNAELIYVGMAGTQLEGAQAYAGHLFQAAVSDAAPVPATWNDLWLSPVTNDPKGFNPADFSISSVVVDPHDTTGESLYVTVEGFDTLTASTGSVYSTANGGASWVNIRSNLPDAPANSIAVDPNDANTVYVALDTGVYVTTAVMSCETENCWSVYGTGLPNAPVIELSTFLSGDQALLRAATYGRGIWQIPLVTAASTETTAAVNPSKLSFAAQPLQTQSGAQTITLTDSGAIALVVSAATASGDFAIVNNCSNSLASGGNCTFQVTFTPTATGTRNGTLILYANVAGGQLTVPLSGTGVPGAAIVLLPTSMSFGSSLLGVATAPAQNVTISNTGGVTVALQSPTVTGDFSIVANTCSASLAPNFGCTVGLVFTPTASGARTGVFSITDTFGTQSATLSGIGISPATDTVGPSRVAFAPQVVGTISLAQAVTLSNSGDSPLNSIAVSVTGDFHVVNSCGNSLIGHANCSLTVTYVPTQVGPESGTLVIVDMYGRPQTVALTGTGLAPAGVSALPTSLSFGPWGLAATSSPQNVTLTNSGGVPLNALTFAVTGAFAIAGNSCPAELASGADCVVQVSFSPAGLGPLSGALTIASPALAKPFEVVLVGSGLDFSIQADGASAATITSGQTANYLLQIVPDGPSTGTLALTCSAAPPNSVCTMNPASMQLSVGVTASVAVSISTIATTSASSKSRAGSPLFGSVALFPTGLFLFPFARRKRVALATLFFMFMLLGCGVTANVGSSSAATTPPGTTPSATYNPVITATGPGIAKSVQLTLIVE